MNERHIWNLETAGVFTYNQSGFKKQQTTDQLVQRESFAVRGEHTGGQRGEAARYDL
jgi:hypothetical protein